MTVSSIAAEVLFSAGWIAIGAAAAYSRYKKALETEQRADGAVPAGDAREYLNGLYFGSAGLSEATGSGPGWKEPDKTALRGVDAEAMAPASLACLAQALENAETKVQPAEEKVPAS